MTQNRLPPAMIVRGCFVRGIPGQCCFDAGVAWFAFDHFIECGGVLCAAVACNGFAEIGRRVVGEYAITDVSGQEP
jgi:hypothetical protein